MVGIKKLFSMWIMFFLKRNFFFVIPESGLRSKRQHNGSNRLDIKPSGPHHKPVGKNLFFTCKAEVSNPSLVRDLKWLKPSGQNIPEDDRLEISKFRNFLNRFDLRKGNIYLVSKINSLWHLFQIKIDSVNIYKIIFLNNNSSVNFPFETS